MREILFRGKPINERSTLEWIEGGIKTKDGRAFIIGMSSKMRVEAMEVYPNTVGQYTGLCDKNGTKIFEGDILEHHVQSDIIVCRGEVFWETKNGRWALRLNTMNPCFYMHNPEAVEVIGNIHYNPELLGGGE